MKRLILLWVMNVISLAVPILSALLIYDMNKNKTYITFDPLPLIGLISAAAVFFGIFGIVSCVKYSSTPSFFLMLLSSFLALWTGYHAVEYLLSRTIDFITICAFLYFALYTAGAVLAYTEKKKYC